MAADSPGAGAGAEEKNVFARFYGTTKGILFSSIFNVLLVFVPVGIAARFAHLSPAMIFAFNAIAIVPLAGLLSHATESVASRLGDTIGALMNVTFGNAVELIIFIIALVKDEIRIVQASLLGSILANLLLILGMCFLFGGLRFREQIYNSTVTQMSSCLLSLSVISLLLPTAFHASFNDTGTADAKVLQVSRGTSVVLLLVYVLYLLFQLNSHSYMYESTPQHVIDAEMVPGPAAQYFDSSSSDSSSDSDSTASTRSNSTAKRLKNMVRGRRSRKHSTSSQTAPKPQGSSGPASPVDESVPEANAASGPVQEFTILDPSTNETVPVKVMAVNRAGADEASGNADPEEPEKPRKKHKKHRHHRQRKPQSEDGQRPQTASVAPEQDGTRRVDFVLMPDVEAQAESSRPKPFSLRTLRPQLPKSISQNVFTAPPMKPTGNQPQRTRAPDGDDFNPSQRRLRRARTMPERNPTVANRTAPGAIPPINPIVVNSTPKSKPGSADGAGAGVTGATETDDEHEGPAISRTTAIVLLLVSTGLVALCAEFMVDSINSIVGDGTSDTGISEAFIGLILLPIVGNAAEHVTAVTVAMKNKMDLAIGVALGSSIQIALFVTPLVVILGWIMNKEMTLYFTLFETVSLFVSAFIVNFLVLDGRSNYLEGALLCSAYILIAVSAFFFPDTRDANTLGGGTDKSTNTTTQAAVVVARMAFGGVRDLVGDTRR